MFYRHLVIYFKQLIDRMIALAALLSYTKHSTIMREPHYVQISLDMRVIYKLPIRLCNKLHPILYNLRFKHPAMQSIRW